MFIVLFLLVVRREFVDNMNFNTSGRVARGNTGRNVMRFMTNAQLLHSRPDFRSGWGDLNSGSQRHSSNINTLNFVNTGQVQSRSTRLEDLSREDLIMRLRTMEAPQVNTVRPQQIPNPQPSGTGAYGSLESSFLDDFLLLLSDIGFENVGELNIESLSIQRLRNVRRSIEESTSRFINSVMNAEDRELLYQ